MKHPARKPPLITSITTHLQASRTFRCFLLSSVAVVAVVTLLQIFAPSLIFPRLLDVNVWLLGRRNYTNRATLRLHATRAPPTGTLFVRKSEVDGSVAAAASGGVGRKAVEVVGGGEKDGGRSVTSQVLCSDVMMSLVERIDVDEEFNPNMQELGKNMTALQDGGYYKPANCTSTSKVAILIPFRDREQHLHVFLYYMHPMLQHQHAEYCIYVIEQVGTSLFNRGMLFNVGVKEALKDRDYDCFALHDVDLIPENQKNFYRCSEKAKHMSALIYRSYRKYSWRPYYSNFGGVALVKREHYEKINGFSNVFWGWGGEDDDISMRLMKSHIPRERVNETLGAYTMLMKHHTRAPGNKDAMKLVRSGPSRYQQDGLSSTRYNVVNRLRDRLYTRIKVELLRAEA